MVTAQQVDVPPGPGWNADGATNLPETWWLVDRHRPDDLPMSTALFVTIFFEETACCNMVQVKTPAAIGPGQMQVSEIGKVDFFAAKLPKNNFLGDRWDSSMTLLAVNQANATVFTRTRALHPDLKPLTREFILRDNEFAIKMHVKFMQWLAQGVPDGKPKAVKGLLGAQTGGNASANAAFLSGAQALELAMRPDPTINFRWTPDEWRTFYARKRAEFMNALNTARRGIHNNPVPPHCVKFWEFFLPDDFLQNPLGYIRCGF